MAFYVNDNLQTVEMHDLVIDLLLNIAEWIILMSIFIVIMICCQNACLQVWGSESFTSKLESHLSLQLQTPKAKSTLVVQAQACKDFLARHGFPGGEGEGEEVEGGEGEGEEVATNTENREEEGEGNQGNTSQEVREEESEAEYGRGNREEAHNEDNEEDEDDKDDDAGPSNRQEKREQEGMEENDAESSEEENEDRNRASKNQEEGQADVQEKEKSAVITRPRKRKGKKMDPILLKIQTRARLVRQIRAKILRLMEEYPMDDFYFFER